MDNTSQTPLLKRDQTISIRLSAIEKAVIKSSAKKRHLNITQYILLTAMFPKPLPEATLCSLLIKVALFSKKLDSIQAELQERGECSFNFDDLQIELNKIYNLLLHISKQN